ncbi:unnamed protein product [Hermetia illucens]|uniref:RRM domain-containing protein n=1 Tax=Hermetia illucens TaxID=343691 RepID=A0A7R8UVC8_HERIL|nr:transformer-2 protein homolog alpha isoform X2 [Hermetia illucens]CAD7087825.1 unnamed protein product [Hermetia illucens]
MNRRESSRSRSISRSRSPSSVKLRRSLDRKRRSASPARRRRSHNAYSRGRSRNRSRTPSLRRRSRYSNSRSRSFSPQDKKGYYHRKSYSRSPLSERRRHVGTRENPHQSRCLGVFGLCVNTTEQKIYQIFSKFGSIERVQLVIDAKTNRSRGFCFVYFESADDAKVAKQQCCGMEVDDRLIRVDYSITQRAHTPTPGVYMGKPTRLYKEREYHDRYRDEEYRKEKYGKYRERSSPQYYKRDRSRRYYRHSYSRSRSRDRRDR